MDEGNKRPLSFPFVFVSICYLVIVAVCLLLVFSATGGVLVYGLDDAYIHLSIARSLRLHGIWGIDGAQFASLGSSLLWPFFLAGATLVIGHEVWVPFVLNVFFSLACIWCAAMFFRGIGLGTRGQTVALLFFMLVAPLPMLTFIGMEHTLQILFSLLFASVAARVLSNAKLPLSGVVALLALAAAGTAIRYEALFLSAAVCLLLLMKGRVLFAILLGAAAWLPAFVFGVVSQQRGWFFFPTSLVLKSGIAEMGSAPVSVLAQFPILQMLATPSLLFMLAALCFLSAKLARQGFSLQNPEQSFGVIFAVAAIQHFFFGSVDGAVFRYEAYLAALGWVALVRQWAAAGKYERWGSVIKQPWRIAICVAAFCGPRAVQAGLGVPLAARGIFEQQYQMAQFLSQFYPDAAVALNDIGVVSYRTNVKILDLYGLADVAVVRAKRQQAFDPGAIEKFAQNAGVKIAILYPEWFDRYGGLPPRWFKAGQWSVPYTFVCGSPSVSFYATDPAEASRLQSTLAQFKPTLPPWVTAQP